MGLIITPRCDLAHRKTTILNYISIISLADYLERFATPLVLRRLKDKIRQQLIQAAATVGCLAAVEIGIPASELRTLASNSGKSAKLISSFQQIIDKAESVDFGVANESLSGIEESFIVNERHKVAVDVARNNVIDAHFLPAYPPLLHRPSVALFRCIGACSIDFFDKASRAVMPKQWQKLCQTQSSSEYSCPSRPEPLLRLRSPYLESLVFRYVSLYTRIGVQDIDESVLTEIAVSMGGIK